MLKVISADFKNTEGPRVESPEEQIAFYNLLLSVTSKTQMLLRKQKKRAEQWISLLLLMLNETFLP